MMCPAIRRSVPMPDSTPNLPLLGAPGEACFTCAALLAADQRYCLECGSRRGAPRLDPLAHARGATGGAAAGLVPDIATAEPAVRSQLGTVPALRALGRPRVLATAAILVLGFGVAIGDAAGPPAATGLPLAPRILVSAPPAAPASVPATTTDASSSDTSTADTSVADTSSTDVAADPITPVATDPAPAAPAPSKPASGGTRKPTSTTPKPPAPIKHTWLIALREAPTAQPFDTAAPAPVATELVRQGTVLTHYASIAPGSLANRIALLSGQAPTAATLAECPTYNPVTPGTIAKKTGLVAGDGCIYPPKTVTLTDQLTGAGLAWKGYFEDMGAAPPPGSTSCRHPDAGQADPFALPRPADAYLTRSDPFVYFRSITESPDCGSNVVGLDRLAPDLATVDQTPAFSLIAPNACHDGSGTPCAAGADAGLASANTWLTSVVPQILASPAYADGGLVVITFDGAPAVVPPAAGDPKGTTVGALLLSPYVTSDTTVDAPYDHYALLKTLGRIYGVPALGHAADKAVTSFGAKVFANAPAAGSD